MPTHDRFPTTIFFFHSIQKPISTKVTLIHDLSRYESTACHGEAQNDVSVSVECRCILCAHKSIRHEKYIRLSPTKTTFERWKICIKIEADVEKKSMLWRNEPLKNDKCLPYKCDVVPTTLTVEIIDKHTHTHAFSPHMSYAYHKN